MTFRLFVGAIAVSTFALGCSSNLENDEPTGAEQSDLVASESANAPEQHCVVTLAKLQPGETVSRVLSRECSAEAKDLTTSEQDILLMVVYEHTHFNGSSTTIRGEAACDSSGYGFADLSWSGFNDRISSFKTFNYCNQVVGYEHANYGGMNRLWGARSGSWNLDQGEVHYMNDIITSFRTWRS